ncbi:amino acid ABC transporter permease [Saccharothrix violaceirubra]|uniref:Polar amino acid transport system permease protein n=1 Tax=Saccharothrix violaceirubra TaxID=413306 RepID=A0A7W7TA81_9PSEU|nr:amino acid ABC transporter permease [Saccharothrix violaceirubra]MBB4969403.1 polar amino acid transport system permease protein [Saccharothrix violaceirubra]
MALSKRQRARYLRGGQYGVLVLVVVVAAAIADWGQLRKAFFNTESIKSMFPEVITVALKNTVVYTAVGFGFGLLLGLLLALMRLSSVAPYRWIAIVYIEIMRGVPALLVFIAVYFGAPIAFQIQFDLLSTVMIALGGVGAAYMAETIRAGIQAVPKGQIEAARSLGMSPLRTNLTVVIPQAFRIVLPPLTNELILLTKDSSLIYLLGVARDQYELTKFGREALSRSPSITPLVVAGLSYLIITLPLGHLSRRLERRTGGKKISVDGGVS